MKLLYKLSILVLGFTFFTSCEKDETFEIQEQDPTFTVENSGFSDLTLNFSFPENPSLLVNFQETSMSSINVVMSTDSEFTNPIALGMAESQRFSINTATLNSILLDAGASPFKPFSFFVRGENGTSVTETLSYTAITYVEDDPNLGVPTQGSTITLDGDAPDNIAATFAFTDFDTVGATVSVQYDLQAVSSGLTFDGAAINVSSNSSNGDFDSTFNLSNSALNSIAGANGIEADSTGDLDFILTATITTDTGVLIRTSEISTITVTTFAEPLGPRLAVPGPHQDGGIGAGQWNPNEMTEVAFVPYLEASGTGQTDYEGFVYLLSEWKLVAPDNDGVFNWGNTDYGDASGQNGSYTQVLTADGEGNCGVPEGEGYYFVQADTGALTYSMQKTDWGIIGFATTGDDSGWSQDMDMTFDRASRTWSITLDLSVGEFKFRANDDWGTNFGAGENPGSLEFNSPTNLSVSQAGTYEVILDLSNPRGYQVSLNLQ